MKTILALTLACLLSACATGQQTADARSYVIHHPDTFGSNPPEKDDDGNAMPGVPQTAVAVPVVHVAPPAPAVAAKEPFPWASGTARVAD